jgi:hypothetical protein
MTLFWITSIVADLFIGYGDIILLLIACNYITSFFCILIHSGIILILIIT